VASALWGTILGAMLAGFPGERFGPILCAAWQFCI